MNRLTRCRLPVLLGVLLIGLAGCGEPAVDNQPPRIITRIVTAPPAALPTSAQALATDVPAPTATRAATAAPAPSLTPTVTPTAFITPPAPGAKAVVPILMYHNLKTLAPDAGETQRTWTVSPEQFAAQLDYISSRGFQTVHFSQVVDFFERPG